LEKKFKLVCLCSYVGRFSFSPGCTRLKCLYSHDPENFGEMHRQCMQCVWTLRFFLNGTSGCRCGSAHNIACFEYILSKLGVCNFCLIFLLPSYDGSDLACPCRYVQTD